MTWLHDLVYNAFTSQTALFITIIVSTLTAVVDPTFWAVVDSFDDFFGPVASLADRRATKMAVGLSIIGTIFGSNFL